ncbi:hypothetical protein ABMA28_010535, partial [Loxostege sticticalis]
EDDDIHSILSLKTEISDYMLRTAGSNSYYEVYPGAERPDYDFTLERHAATST